MMSKTLNDEIEDLTAPSYQSCSVSPVSVEILSDLERAIVHYHEPISSGGFRRELYQEFKGALSRFDFKNTSKIEREYILQSIQNALKFIQVIPKYSIDPEITIDADFGIIFDWHVSRFKNFSAITGSKNYLNYAGIHGNSIQHGKEILNEKFPDSFDTWIKRIN